MAAARGCSVMEVQRLLAEGAQVNAADASGLTPLHVAGDSETAKLLLGAGADVNAGDKNGRTPLHKAKSETVQLLLSAGANVNARDNNGRTPLHNVTGTTQLLVDAGADVNARDRDGKTPLHVAAHDYDAYWLKLLLEAGADAHAADQGGNTPLFYAAEKHFQDHAWLLLKAGAHVNASNQVGSTPLRLAIENMAILKVDGVRTDPKGQEFLRLLMNAGANANAADEDGKTPLQEAVSACGYMRHSDTIFTLCWFGADVSDAGEPDLPDDTDPDDDGYEIRKEKRIKAFHASRAWDILEAQREGKLRRMAYSWFSDEPLADKRSYFRMLPLWIRHDVKHVLLACGPRRTWGERARDPTINSSLIKLLQLNAPQLFTMLLEAHMAPPPAPVIE